MLLNMHKNLENMHNRSHKLWYESKKGNVSLRSVAVV